MENLALRNGEIKILVLKYNRGIFLTTLYEYTVYEFRNILLKYTLVYTRHMVQDRDLPILFF